MAVSNNALPTTTTFESVGRCVLVDVQECIPDLRLSVNVCKRPSVLRAWRLERAHQEEHSNTWMRQCYYNSTVDGDSCASRVHALGLFRFQLAVSGGIFFRLHSLRFRFRAQQHIVITADDHLQPPAQIARQLRQNILWYDEKRFAFA
jgi:hypothetical protein